MVASRQVEIPFSRGIGRQLGWRFVEIAQDFARATTPFLSIHIVPAAKRVGAGLLESAAPDNGENVSGRKYFKTAAKSVGRQTLKKQLESGRRKRTARKVITTKSAKQPVGCEKTLLQTFLIFMSTNFRYQPLFAVSRNLVW